MRETFASPAGESLRRDLGRWDLTAIGVNQVIGAAVFAQPALLAGLAGAWSPWLIVLMGLASMTVALSFAEVASRFDATGGPYLYARAAFGRFAGFEVGWMLWFTRVTSWAAVVNVLVTSIGYYWPAATDGLPRGALITGVIAALAAISVSGIRQSSAAVNAFTVGKLLPLAVFIGAGLFAIEPARLVPAQAPTLEAAGAAALLLIFAYGGYEVVPVLGGEARDPGRQLPFALVMTLVLVTAVLTLAQVVALGTLAEPGQSATPLADSAYRFLGGAGAALMTLGATISASGNNLGQVLSGSRNLFALAEQGDLPAFFGRVHPRFRTPVSAILVTAAVSLVLAVSGRFAALAASSAVSRLLVYAVTCAATLRLRSPRFASRVRPARFVVPFGPAIPAAAILIALVMLLGATARQLQAGALALAAGAILYLVAVAKRMPESAGAPRRSAGSTEPGPEPPR